MSYTEQEKKQALCQQSETTLRILRVVLISIIIF
ncbi:hypothetical protein BN3662_01047 [Clostridiales bacterium CHKCI006]|nr:hypothetical protein BN3662_01047 [Clostridiales bacterium CHKCI006]